MAKNVGTFSLYLDLQIDTKNAIRRLQGVESELRGQINRIFAGFNKDNLGSRLESSLQNTFGKTTTVLGNTGQAAGLSFGNAVLAGVTSILTSAAVLGIVDKAFSGVKDFFTKAFTSGIETEKQGIAFRVLLGDPEKAKQLFRDINNLAVKTPFDISDLRDITKRLLGYGFALEEVVGVTKMLGDVAAGTGGDLKLLAKAYGQVRTLGKVYAEELNQFAEQGVALRELLAKNRGITVQQLVKGMDTGKIVITFEEFKKVFEDLYKSKFMNLMAEQADTLGGRLQNLSETLSLVGQEIIGIDTLTGRVKEGSLFDLISRGLLKLLDFLRENSDKIQEFLSRILRGLTDVLLKVFNFLRDNWDEIQEFFSWTVKELAQPFKDLGITTKDIFLFLKSLIPLLKSALPVFGFLLRLGVILLKISLYFNSFFVFIRTGLTTVENLKTSIQQITNLFTDELKRIQLVLANLKTAFNNLFSGNFLSFYNQLKQVFADLLVLIQGLFSKIPELWQIYSNFLSNQINQTLNWFLAAFGLNLSILQQKFLETFNNLLEIIKNWFLVFASSNFGFDLGVNLGTQLGMGVRSAFLSIMENIKSLVLGLVNELIAEIRGITAQINNLKNSLKPPSFKLPSFKLPGFASGGSFIVDGKPGIDQNLVAFWATKGERVIVQTPQEQNIDNRKYIQKTIIYTTQANQFLPIFMQ